MTISSLVLFLLRKWRCRLIGHYFYTPVGKGERFCGRYRQWV